MNWQEIAAILTGVGGLIAGMASYLNGRKLPAETIKDWQQIASNASKDILELKERLDAQDLRINELVRLNAYLRAHNLLLTRQLLDAEIVPMRVDPKEFNINKDILDVYKNPDA